VAQGRRCWPASVPASASVRNGSSRRAPRWPGAVGTRWPLAGGTPGLRTLTVVASASSALPARVALPLLVLGSTVFLEAHLVLGYLLGPAAAELVRRAGPLLVVLVALLAVAVLVRSVVRRRAGVAPVQAWSEAVCPACLAVTAIERRSGGRQAL
jgi:hypothetical protein